MGAGASAGTANAESRHSTTVEPSTEHKHIPLAQLIRHLHLYQHGSSGDVLILVDHELKDIPHLVDRADDWFRVSLAKQQVEYTGGIHLVTSLPRDLPNATTPTTSKAKTTTLPKQTTSGYHNESDMGVGNDTTYPNNKNITSETKQYSSTGKERLRMSSPNDDLVEIPVSPGIGTNHTHLLTVPSSHCSILSTSSDTTRFNHQSYCTHDDCCREETYQ